MMAATPKQRHREGVLARDGAVCRWAEQGDCGGRLQSAHIISVQRLRLLYSRAEGKTAYRGALGSALLDVPLDEVLADPRNGCVACELHHVRYEGAVLHLDSYPEPFLEFVADYSLEHVIDFARNARAA